MNRTKPENRPRPDTFPPDRFADPTRCGKCRNWFATMAEQSSGTVPLTEKGGTLDSVTPVGGMSRSGLNPPNYGLGSVPRPVRVNEQEFGTPRTSAQGFQWKARTGQNVVREAPPIIPKHVGMFVYKDYIGAFVARNAGQIPIIRRYFYSGELPMGAQPLIIKPLAWNDPTRGQP